VQPIWLSAFQENRLQEIFEQKGPCLNSNLLLLVVCIVCIGILMTAMQPSGDPRLFQGLRPIHGYHLHRAENRDWEQIVLSTVQYSIMLGRFMDIGAAQSQAADYCAQRVYVAPQIRKMK
jgi:hypothetical protein